VGRVIRVIQRIKEHKLNVTKAMGYNKKWSKKKTRVGN
jgi:hypothetical protein